MKAAVITLNYNGKKDTLELLSSLKSLDKGNLEVLTLVVDNASSDGSVAEIKKKFPKVKILQTGQNLGFAGGYNRGLDFAKIWGADYFLLINNDCIIKDANLLTELIRTIEADEKRGFASPKIYFAKGFEFRKDYQEDELGKVIWFAGGHFDWDNIGNIHRGIDEVDRGQYDWVEAQGIFSGACVLIKKEALEKLNGFDEKYFLYFEDSELAKRALGAGFKIFYNGTVSIYHKVSRSTGIGSGITDYYHTRNRLIFGMKYARLRTKFALLREALKLFLLGRPAQRRGIVDFYLDITGGVNLSRPKDVQYPLKLSIGIVNYNTADLTEKLIKSILKKGSGYDAKYMEVIVLDNGKIDPAKKRIKKYLNKIKYLENEENEGFSKGYNKTIKYAQGEYYLMLNSDIEVLPKAILEIVKASDQFEGEAVLGGKLLFPDLTDQDSAFHLPTITGAFSQYFLGKYGAYFMFEPYGEHPSKVEGLVMACFLIPGKVLNKAGLLDESKFIFFEDIEYCRRLKDFGIPVYFVPSAKFIHHHGASTKKIGIDKANTLLTDSAKKYHGQVYYFLLTWVLRLGQKFGIVETPKSRWQTS